jgi:glutathionyl-hydroquinone reductase
VYRSGFATTQSAYEKAVVEVFDALDKVEKILTGKDYLVGDKLTEADVRLWVTIVCLNLTIGSRQPFSLFGVSIPVRFASILSTLVISSAISAQSVTDIRPSTSKIYFSILKIVNINMNLMNRWMQKLYWNCDAFKDSTNFEHIKTHYYWSHTSVSSIFHFC